MPEIAPPPFPTPLEPVAVVDSTDGVRLALHDLGGDDLGGDVRPVLFVHATGFCAGIWRPLVARLRGVRAFALDVRAHGHSSAPIDGFDWRGVGSDVLRAVEALGLRRPLGVGHSMGGAGLLLAELARPGTFEELWIYEPVVFPPSIRPADPDAPNPMVDAARRRRPWFTDRAAAFANFASKPPLSELHPESLTAYVTDGFSLDPDGTVHLRCRPDWEAEVYRFGARHDTFERLGEVQCPVTVATGCTDLPGPGAFAAAIAERLPNGRLEDHPDLAHFGPLAALDAVAERLTEWAATPRPTGLDVGDDF